MTVMPPLPPHFFLLFVPSATLSGDFGGEGRTGCSFPLSPAALSSSPTPTNARHACSGALLIHRSFPGIAPCVFRDNLLGRCSSPLERAPLLLPSCRRILWLPNRLKLLCFFPHTMLQQSVAPRSKSVSWPYISATSCERRELRRSCFQKTPWDGRYSFDRRQKP